MRRKILLPDLISNKYIQKQLKTDIKRYALFALLEMISMLPGRCLYFIIFKGIPVYF